MAKQWSGVHHPRFAIPSENENAARTSRERFTGVLSSKAQLRRPNYAVVSCDVHHYDVSSNSDFRQTCSYSTTSSRGVSYVTGVETAYQPSAELFLFLLRSLCDEHQPLTERCARFRIETSKSSAKGVFFFFAMCRMVSHLSKEKF